MCARIFSNNGTQTKGAVISEYQALEHIVVVCELLSYPAARPPCSISLGQRQATRAVSFSPFLDAPAASSQPGDLKRSLSLR